MDDNTNSVTTTTLVMKPSGVAIITHSDDSVCGPRSGIISHPSYIQATRVELLTVNYTISIWVKISPTNFNARYNFLSTRADSSSGIPFWGIQIRPVGLLFELSETGYGNYIEPLSPGVSMDVFSNVWRHLVVVKSGTRGMMYLDGVIFADIPNAMTKNPVDDTPLMFGNAPLSSIPATMLVDEFRRYNNPVNAECLYHYPCTIAECPDENGGVGTCPSPITGNFTQECDNNLCIVTIAMSSGATPPYFFKWSDGVSSYAPFRININESLLSTFNVTVVDSNNCYATIGYKIRITAEMVQIPCYSNSSGIISTTTINGIAPFTYMWTGTTISARNTTDKNLSGLGPGKYWVQAIDSRAEKSNIFEIELISNAIITATITPTNTCSDRDTGIANVTISGGTQPYNLRWSKIDGDFTSYSSSVDSLSAGDYSLIVNDNVGCSLTRIFTIARIENTLTLTPMYNNVTCKGANNGQAMVSASGTQKISYGWTNGEITNFISNLTPGMYSVFVYSFCETVNHTFYISEPEKLTASVIAQSASCITCVDGMATVTISGGTSPYNIKWNDISTNQTAFTGGIGNYTINIIDSKGCQTELGITIPYCGDGIVNGGEQCDSPSALCCSPTCTFIPPSVVCRNYNCNGAIQSVENCRGNSPFCPINPNYTCCSGFAFNGTDCDEINECLSPTHNCANNSYCVNTVGSYQCRCFAGFEGNGFTSCTERQGRSCSIKNGFCDPRVTCFPAIGNLSLSCGDCPVGFSGTGNTSCQALCGNSVCEPDLGENCVSCPIDCKIYPCGICADGFCNSTLNETCKTCPHDCGLCVEPSCPSCVNGHCEKGVCMCSGSWSGPSCEQENNEFEVEFPTKEPGVILAASKIQFSVTIDDISEVDSESRIIYKAILSDLNITAHETNHTFSNFTRAPLECSSCNQLDYIKLESNGSFIIYKSQAILDNGAVLELIIWKFGSGTTNLSFANTVTSYNENSLKLGLQILKWPFKALSNSLRFTLGSASNAPSECEVSVDSNLDENSNVKWTMQSQAGVSLYGTFLDKAIVDGRVRDISFKKVENKIVAIMPHFWENAVMDPSYSVLFDSNGGEQETDCTAIKDKKSKSKVSTAIIIVAIVIPVVVVLALVSVIVFVPQVRDKFTVWFGKRNTKRTSTDFSLNHKEDKIELKKSHKTRVDSIQIERISDMSVTTSAGTFHVEL